MNERMTPKQLETHEAGGSHETDVLCAEIRASWADHAAAIERIESEIGAYAGLEMMYNAASSNNAKLIRKVELAQAQLQSLSQPSEGEPHARMWRQEAMRLAQKYSEETFYHSPVCVNKTGKHEWNDQGGFISIDFFNSFEAAYYVGKLATLEADILEGKTGQRCTILSRHHISGGAYEIGIVFDDIPVRHRFNRTRFLKFFRLLSDAELNQKTADDKLEIFTGAWQA